MRPVVYLASLLLGVASGTAAVAVHRLPYGLLLGAGTALVVLWALRQWLRRAAAAFALGWIAVLVTALAGRGEGDYVVASDGRGFVLIAVGLLVLVTGLVSTAPPRPRDDSGSSGART